MTAIISLPKILDDGRIDIILKLIKIAKDSRGGSEDIRLNWAKTSEISPAGFAILSALFDTFIEQKSIIKNIDVPKKFRNLPVVNNLINIGRFSSFPDPNVCDYEDLNIVVRGRPGTIDTLFTERIDEKFSDFISEDLLYAAKLTINELMQNSADHSSAERYYVYAGLWKREFHVGLLDMGITIPAKLEQKYVCGSDLEYLELALKKGSGTRRQRTGGFGLYYFFEFLKESMGKLTIVSRGAQVRRYFRTRKSQKSSLKYPLPGTWCFARFPLEV